MTTRELILYTKPGCHLCEGLQEKLALIQPQNWTIEVRDITSREDWFNAYQYEVPILCQKLSTGEKILPRLSPRANSEQLARLLANNLI
jgi:hypothetical protein